MLTVDPPCEATAFRLQIDRSQAYRVYDEFDPQNIRELPDGSFEAAAAYPEDDWLYGYILSFGPYAKVLEPERLRRQIEDRLCRTLARYKPDGTR